MKYDGYASKDKTEAVKYIANTSNQTYVKSQAEKALRGEASLDSALVRAAIDGTQLVIRTTGKSALGIDERFLLCRVFTMN